jgi:hypothetical protein
MTAVFNLVEETVEYMYFLSSFVVTWLVNRGDINEVYFSTIFSQLILF